MRTQVDTRKEKQLEPVSGTIMAFLLRVRNQRADLQLITIILHLPSGD